MPTRILFISFLLLLVGCMASAINLRHPSRRFPPPCCVSLSTANIRDDVIGDTYRKPTARSPCLEAIILTTQHGPVCVNAKTEWVRRLIANMRRL